MINQEKQILVFLNKKNFKGKLKKDDGPTMFSIAEKQQKTILNFSLEKLTVTEQYK